ncbi:hypothetical protein PAHAL_2G162900 [Panicum hallii]|uniref:Uncharacterized protein n=1 Tax=Panicum hallii TaxID=206008 RepID=A0A2T8KPF6_9POAL|nr:hypothetical protein PAHAL_2G162900 [Panicum hallii]
MTRVSQPLSRPLLPPCHLYCKPRMHHCLASLPSRVPESPYPSHQGSPALSLDPSPLTTSGHTDATIRTTARGGYSTTLLSHFSCTFLCAPASPSPTAASPRCRPPPTPPRAP